MSYLILAQSKVTARALGAWLELLGERPVTDPKTDSRCIEWGVAPATCGASLVNDPITDSQSIFIRFGGLRNKGTSVNDPITDERCMVVEQLTRNGDQGVDAFEMVVDRITKALADAAPLPLTVLVDAVNPGNLNPLSDGGGWDSLLAMLILAAPEARWVFGVISGDLPIGVDWNWHNLPAMLAKPWRNPLLDPTGLRDWIREIADAALKDRPLGLARRSCRAAAIDEEVHYALFHAYTAYRFGYRADAVLSWQLMETMFGAKENASKPELDKDPKEETPHVFHLLLEDVNLYFPDRPAKTHLSTFDVFEHEKDGSQGRAKHCAKLGYGRGHQTSGNEPRPLESSEFRIIVTSGHSGSSPHTMEQNRQYVKDNKPNGWGFVLKPTGGMFDLWAKSRLFERLRPGSSRVADVRRPGLAPGFQWPPKPDGDATNGSGSHSAPGKLMLVASHLVRRADALRDNANTVEECIRGAVLATEAVELLGYRTPTLALQALELKQWFETKAEVAFVGVGHHFQLARRFKEIERETRVAARFHHKGRRDAAALDAGVTIANRLTLVFREAGQFDEEVECLRKLRWWNRKLSFRRARNKFYLWPGLGLLAYAEWMISSLGWLLLSVIGWMLLLALVWWAWTMDGHSWEGAVKGTLGAFIGSGVTTDEGPGIVFLSSFSALLGFFHLGVFVSYLYSAIARK